VLRHNDRLLLLVRDLTVPVANDRDWVSSVSDETSQEFKRYSFGRALR